MSLSDRSFIDMVLGQDFCDIKVETPNAVELTDAQLDHPDEVQALRTQCIEALKNGPEFTLQHDGMRFRVTTMVQETGPVWFLSRIDAQIRPLEELPVPSEFVSFALRPGLQGLILITGGFGTGKTTTASSLFSHRIATLGGTGVALEDPAPEVRMDGRCGAGRIVQIPISRKQGGYHAGLQLVRRSRADSVFVGEIRDAVTAVEAQDIANADMPIIATMHASSIEETFDKYQAYLRSAHASSGEANARLALSVAGVLHLTREHVIDSAGQSIARYTPRCLILDRTDPQCFAPLGKIRDGNFLALKDDIASQASRRFRNE